MKLTLFEKKHEIGNVYSFIFKPDKPIIWQAGQYMFYTLPDDNPDNRGVTRYFTISSAPFEKHIQITTRISEVSSSFKKDLMKMKIGQKIEANGPDGDFTITSPGRKYVFIAGGIGITPFRSILLELTHNTLKINVRLMYTNHDNYTVFKGELESLISKNPNLKIKYFISPVHITKNDIQSLNTAYYVSGPEPFVQSYSQILKNIGIKQENIKLDFFPGYDS